MSTLQVGPVWLRIFGFGRNSMLGLYDIVAVILLGAVYEQLYVVSICFRSTYSVWGNWGLKNERHSNKAGRDEWLISYHEGFMKCSIIPGTEIGLLVSNPSHVNEQCENTTHFYVISASADQLLFCDLVYLPLSVLQIVTWLILPVAYACLKD